VSRGPELLRPARRRRPTMGLLLCPGESCPPQPGALAGRAPGQPALGRCESPKQGCEPSPGRRDLLRGTGKDGDVQGSVSSFRCALAVSVLSRQARTPLEQEIFGLLHKTQQPITDPLLTPEETASLQAMSLEEVGASPRRALAPGPPRRSPSPSAPRQARRRRAELQKARVVQSYYEAKARREKKIKSKK